MAKLPIEIKAQIEALQEGEIARLYDVVERCRIELAADDTNQALHTEWCMARGKLEGCYLVIDKMLQAFDCYKGFTEWEKVGITYRESYRHYYL